MRKWEPMIIRFDGFGGFGGFDGFGGFGGFGGLPDIKSETKDRDAGTSV